MERLDELDLLIVAVGARVKIGPGDRDRVRIVAYRRHRGIDIARVEMMSCTDTGEIADGTAQVHVVPREQHAAAFGAKRTDLADVFLGQAVPDIDREEPQLLVVAVLERGEQRIRRAERIAVPRRYLEEGSS